MAQLKYILPLALGALVLLGWQLAVRHLDVPVYVLPAPSDIARAFVTEMPSLVSATLTTLRIVVIAFILATVSGIGLAILFSQSRIIEYALFPYAVILQVTPVVAIAPLLIIWVHYENIDLALLILAWIVAFFPIVASTTLGLRSADFNLVDLFRLHGAGRWQILWRLRLPCALPYLLGAMKISGGLALIGTIVAEFAAGTGTATGLGWLITESENRLHTATTFAALAILAALGIGIFFALSALEWALLHHWHESALRKQE